MIKEISVILNDGPFSWLVYCYLKPLFSPINKAMSKQRKKILLTSIQNTFSGRNAFFYGSTAELF